MEEQILSLMQQYHMIAPGERVIVGVSGGADSVCLLLVLNALKGRLGLSDGDLHAVHINHGLRENTADRDEAFVRELCEKLGVPLTVVSPDVKGYAKENGQSAEEAARTLRYKAFRDKLGELGGGKIAVAHHAGDQAETVLFHLVRGSGIAGMAGMLPLQGDVIRPLLFTKRSEIEAYLASKEQSFCEDETNADPTYSRNRLRHLVMPELASVNSGAVDHINRFAREAAEIEAYFQKETKTLFSAVVEDEEEDWISLSVEALLTQPEYMRRRLLYEALRRVCKARKDIAHIHVAGLVKLLDGDTGRMVNLPYGVRARRSYDTLWIEKYTEVTDEVEEDNTFTCPISIGEELILPNGGRLLSRILTRDEIKEIPKNLYTKVFDYDKIKDALCVRTPREFDEVKIDTAGKSKSISRIMIDAKIDRNRRSAWPIVADEASVLWVIGLRYNECFRLDEGTKTVLSLTYIPEGEDDGREDQCID